MKTDKEEAWIIQQAERFTLEAFSGSPEIFGDTTNFMYIDRGHLIELGGELFMVRGNEKEGRFGLDEQPKFWVKRAISLTNGQKYILKLVCQEAFKIQIGLFRIMCSRSAEKEAQVLDLVRGDHRFMQGRSERDSHGNLVRVIDFINGTDLLNYICSLNMPHEEYFRVVFPSLLTKAITAFKAIQFLNENGLCHGDIRNDHILIERETGAFRWIDFDLTQDFSDFDLWSLGNILHCLVGKGFVTFRDTIREQPWLSGLLGDNDASAFFPHRVMNMRKIHPYVPENLNSILLRFSQGAPNFYSSISEVVEDLGECATGLVAP
jgi:serine/threonine protein kinase